jgi:prefoldin subunit 5
VSPDIAHGANKDEATSAFTGAVMQDAGLVLDVLLRIMEGTRGCKSQGAVQKEGPPHMRGFDGRSLQTSTTNTTVIKVPSIRQLTRSVNQIVTMVNTNNRNAKNLQRDSSWLRDILTRTNRVVNGTDISIVIGVQSLVNTLTLIEQEVQQVANEVGRLQQTVTSSSVTLNTVSSNVTRHVNMISELQATMNALESTIVNVTTSLSSLTDSVDSKTTTIVQLRTEASQNAASTTALVTAAASALSKANAQQAPIQVAANKLQCVDASKSDEDDIYFVGCNVNIVNGAGGTAVTNGLGNLIIGSNEDGCNGAGCARTGSHNLVLGTYNSYTSHSGIVAGSENIITKPFASVTAGRQNEATGDFAVVSGGTSNKASGALSSVSGGLSGEALGYGSSVAGGYLNVAQAAYSTVKGGKTRVASVARAVVP